MEANNHFNYGTHPTASANSGLKRSSGDSLYTNGSSMSFTQQGKSMNGEMNVNGVSPVLGSAAPGAHPPTAYPHVASHQGSMGYDYLWGGQAQYSAVMGPSPGHGMHPKPPPPPPPPSGLMPPPPPSSSHYPGHEQYQLNGGLDSPAAAAAAAAGSPNMTAPPGGQYWSRGSPAAQQMGFGGGAAAAAYGSYQSHGHPGVSSSQQHHQPPPPAAAHPPSPQHPHPHHHPAPQHHHQHHQHHQQQSQHYGMMPNGLPYYQPHLPALQSPQPPPGSAQPPTLPAAPQNFTPPRGSPQHHTAVPGRERSPRPARAGMPDATQANRSETYQEVEAGCGLMKEPPGGQRLPQSDAFLPKPPLPQGPDVASTSHPSGPPAAVSTPPRASAAPVASSVPGPDPSSSAVRSSPPRAATPPSPASLRSFPGSPRLPPPPFTVHGLRPGSQAGLAGSPRRTAASPSRGPAPLDYVPGPPPGGPWPPSGSEGRKVLFPGAASHAPPTSTTTGALTPPCSGPPPVSALQQMVDGSRSPPAAPRLPDSSRPPPADRCEASGPLTANSSSPAPPAPCALLSTPPRLVPSCPRPPPQAPASPAARSARATVSTASPAPGPGPAQPASYFLPPPAAPASGTPPPLVSSTAAALAAAPPPGQGSKASRAHVLSQQASKPPPSGAKPQEGDGTGPSPARTGRVKEWPPAARSLPAADRPLQAPPPGNGLAHRQTPGPEERSFMDDAHRFGSALRGSSRARGRSSGLEESTGVTESSFLTEDASLSDSTTRREEGARGTADTTLDSQASSLEEEEEFDGSQAGGTSRGELTADSCWDATLESSLNTTSQLEGSNLDSSRLEESNLDSSQLEESNLDSSQVEESNLDSSQVEESNLDSFHGERSNLDSSWLERSNLDSSQLEESNLDSSQVEESNLDSSSQVERSNVDSSQINASVADSFGSARETEEEATDLPDSAGGPAPVSEAAPAPALKMVEEEMTAVMEAPPMPRVPPLTIKTSPVKTPGKTRKPRTPKASSTPVATPAEKPPRKPRARTPKADKTKKPAAEEEEGAAAKVKGAGRKRKKPAKEEAQDQGPDLLGAAAEMDPISAIIEAVLARASEASPPAENTMKPKKARKPSQEGGAAKVPRLGSNGAQEGEEVENDADDSSTAGESNRRRVATELQVQFPLSHGWRREIRVRRTESRMKGETWYYTPCGRRMKQFPEIIKYLKRHQDTVVSREHFSFSPRMPIGDFYEERDTSEGKAWVLLANEEVPSIIMAITGRRGRPPNPDKEKPRRVRAPKGGQVRRPGRPPKPKMVDLLSKVDAKLLKRLETKEALTEEDKEKIAKIKKKMKRKARLKRKDDAKTKKIRDEKKKAKLEKDQVTDGQVASAEPTATAAGPPSDALPAADATQAPKNPRKRRTKAVVPAPVQQTDEERIAQGKRVLGARSKAKALAKAQAEAEAAAQAALSAKRAAERRAQAQRRLEERKRQQTISEELKKPAEDMCLTDHKPLPELSRIPGVVLPGPAFAHCLTVVEFLHGYGKVIGLNIPKDIPSLATLQEGLLGLGEAQGEVQDLLLKLLEAALHDPGLTSYYQSVKILGEKLVDLELTRSTVSEPLRLFLESRGHDAAVCEALRTKTFHALPPHTKASVLGFLVEQLNGSHIVTSDIDNTLENMATYRKNKWIIEGKLRKLKAALARRTGRPEEELCLEERRRSTRVAEEAVAAEEEVLQEENGQPQERASRRGRKEEAKLSDSENANASIPELERQIDKLTKRQQLFRKKLLQSSHSMRAVSLGQDRFRRRYVALPHLGAVLVEGPEELLASEEVLVSEVPVTLLKREPKTEEISTPTSLLPPASSSTPPGVKTPPTTPTPTSSSSSTPEEPAEDGLPGTPSLMSQPRGRGRPRKIKPEVELHLRAAAKTRRRQRSSARPGGEEGPGSPGAAAPQAWLSRTQEPDGAAVGDAPGGVRPEDGVREAAERRGQWFNLLPKEPCDPASLAEPQGGPASPGGPRLPLSTLPAHLAASLLQSESALQGPGPAEAMATPQGDLPTAPLPPSAATPPPPPPPLPSPPAVEPAPTATPPATPARPVRRRRRGSRGSSPARRGARSAAAAAAAKRRGRPPNAVFQELEQQYFTQMVVKPIPASMVRGWWWVQDAEELQAILTALNPRGVREKVLHKHLAKHMESLGQMCAKPVIDPIFQVKVEAGGALMEALQKPWQVEERVLEVDIGALQWVEELEQRVITADLHLKVAPQSVVKTESAEVDPGAPTAEFQPYTAPEPDSTRDDLRYYQHQADPRDDWTVRTKREWSDLPRVATHALDLAVLRLANLERNVERRYLKEPLWNAAEVMRLAPVTPTPGEAPPMDVMSLESEITPRLRTWRQALDRCRSAPQLVLCILQLEKAIAWERSVVKLTCQVCRKGDNDEFLLLCDGCDGGCHMYCLRPKVTQVPEGDWFCPACTAKEDGAAPGSRHPAKTRTRLKRRRYEDDSSDEEAAARAPRRAVGMATRHKDVPTPPAHSSSSTSSSAPRYCGDGGGISPAKRRRMTTRNQPDLTYCEIILMEMEAHADAWPFLEPVNPRLVPGYRRIVKTPMDFLTMRERLLQGGYCSCEEFAGDAQLVFNNCQLFNEDASEVGAAGLAMRRFFQHRWAEFYDRKDQ